MSSTKTNTSTGTKDEKFSQTNQFERLPGAESADIDALRKTQYRVDPTIGFRAGAAKRQLASSFNNPLGGFATPAMRDAITRSESRNIDQQAGMESRAGQYDVNSLNNQKSSFLAGLTAPPLVQSGSSGTSSGTSTGIEKNKTPFSAKIMPAIQSAAQVAAAG